MKIKKVVVLLVLAVFGLASVSLAQAPDLNEAIAEQKAALEGTEWSVEMRPMGGGRSETDVIGFYDGKVGSTNLMNQGFTSTNYSVRFEEDGTVIWETMQSVESGAVAFWRGDIGPDGMMRGVLSLQDAKGNMTNFNFSGTSAR